MSGAAAWLKASVRVASRAAPGPTARLANRLFRRPAIARRLDRGDRALLASAAPIMASGREVWVETPSGRLRAYRFAPDGPATGRALLLHGWTVDARAMGAFVAPMRAAGIDALIPDLPAHGASDGTETDAPAAARAVAALLAAEDFAPDHIIAHSYGGGVAGMLAANGAPPRRLVSIASPSRLRASTEDFVAAFGLGQRARRAFEARLEAAAGRPIDDIDALKIWPGLQTEILILHAPDDEEVAFTEAERLARAPNATLHPLPGLGHRRIIHDPASVAAAMNFVMAP